MNRAYLKISHKRIFWCEEKTESTLASYLGARGDVKCEMSIRAYFGDRSTMVAVSTIQIRGV